ncbi:hypothetical protein FACS1894190_17990 [Spirochaetia bacterium]|nr:hypothetical protein FACS1894190_17990 [Spirochaetia bacterium]
MLIKEDIITRYIRNCKTKNFTPNEQGEIDDDDLSNYIDEFITEIENSIDENCISEILNNKIKSEIETVTTDFTAKMLNTFYLTASSIFNYLLTKYYDDDNVIKRVLGNIGNYAIELFVQIFSLYLSGCEIGILANVRILYENYVVFKYIGKYPDLAESYFDHAVYKKYLLLKEYWKTLTKEEEKEMIEISNKYKDVKNFDADYGWAFKTIENENKRKVATMAGDLKLLDYTELYKVSSNYIHPSSFSVFHKNIVKSLVPNTLLMSIEIFTNTVINLLEYYKCEEKEIILIRNLLYGLREDLYNEPKIYNIPAK